MANVTQSLLLSVILNMYVCVSIHIYMCLYIFIYLCVYSNISKTYIHILPGAQKGRHSSQKIPPKSQVLESLQRCSSVQQVARARWVHLVKRAYNKLYLTQHSLWAEEMQVCVLLYVIVVCCNVLQCVAGI